MKYSQHLLLFSLLSISFLLMAYGEYISPFTMRIFTFSLSKYEEPDKDELKRLQEELTSTKIELEKQRWKVKELEKALQQAKVIQEKIDIRDVAGQISADIIIKKDASNNRNAFTVNKGAEQGVEQGSIVVYNPFSSGVVYLLGIVQIVSKNSSVVVQVSDPQMRIPVHFLVQQPSGMLSIYDKGINVGYSNQECKIKLLEDKGFLPEKGIVVTSGINYPEGLMVGSAQIQKYQNSYIVNVYPPRLDNISQVTIVNMRK